jgi:predicted dehydrogenase
LNEKLVGFVPYRLAVRRDEGAAGPAMADCSTMAAMARPTDADEPATPLPVAVLGAGRMGRHHARIYRELAQARLVGVVDPDAERAHTLADQYGTTGYDCVDALLAAHPDLAAVSIAAPTQQHRDLAEPLLSRGIACLVEKPIAPTVAEAEQLRAAAERAQAVLRVGHTERFNPAVRAVAEMGITPRFIEVDRVSPMTFRSLDVGVVMDMMIHDLDIVLMLMGAPLKQVDAAGINVISDREDVANARLVFDNGGVANLTASRLALKTERKLRLFSESAYVSLDYQRRTGVVIRAADNADALKNLRQELAAGKDLSDMDYSELVQVDELTMELPEGEDDPLTAQLASFLKAARGENSAGVDAEAGYAAVDAAQRVIEAAANHQWQGLDPAWQGK